ncbi:MAG: hypothetical protein ACRCTY_05150 [Candidatus Adiutrix sp.]
MKKIILIFAALIFIAWAPKVGEATQYTAANKITVTVPNGWQAKYDDEHSQILLMPPDHLAGVSIIVLESLGKTDREVAELMSGELKGSQPKQVEGGTNYYFTATVNDLFSTFTLLENQGQILIYSEFGDLTKFENEVQEIWLSLQSEDRRVQAIFDAIAK